MRAEQHEVVRAVHQLAHRLRAEQHFEQPDAATPIQLDRSALHSSLGLGQSRVRGQDVPFNLGDLLTDSLELLADLDVVGDLLGQLDARTLEFLADRLLLGLALLERQLRGECGRGCAEQRRRSEDRYEPAESTMSCKHGHPSSFTRAGCA